MNTMARFCIGLLVGLAAAGCTDNDESLLILNNIAPGDMCVPQSNPSGTFITSGIIDVSITDGNETVGYIMTPVVQSLTQTTTTTNAPRVTTIEGYNIDISFEDSGSTSFSNLSFSRSLGVSIQPNSFAGFGIEIVPAQLLTDLNVGPGDARFLSVDVQFFGKLDGGDIESNTFTYPVQVCNGCLISNVGACTDIPTGFVPNEGGECNLYQDFPLDCCQSDTFGLRCPAVAEEVVL